MSELGRSQRAGRFRRVLVFQIGSFGDTLLSLPALHVLRDHVGPAGRIVVLHDDQGDGRVQPPDVLPASLVDGFVSYPFRPGRLARAAVGLGLVRKLRAQHFDAVVNLSLADRPAAALARDERFFRWCAITEQIGFGGSDGNGRSEAEVRVGRLRAAGIDDEIPRHVPLLTPTPDAVAAVDAWFGEERAGGGLVALAPDTLMDAKRWDLERWRRLGHLLVAAGHHPVVVGGPAISAIGDDLVSSWGAGRNAAGEFDVQGSAAVIARAVLHVGLDTGTTHLAAALGRPVVALYSRRAPVEQWRPLGDDVTVISHPVPCDGCQEVACPVVGHPCMTQIEVDEVWAAVQARLGPATAEVVGR